MNHLLWNANILLQLDEFLQMVLGIYLYPISLVDSGATLNSFSSAL